MKRTRISPVEVPKPPTPSAPIFTPPSGLHFVYYEGQESCDWTDKKYTLGKRDKFPAK
ncbi:MAG: hypothetical protein K0Q87_4541 [Neobacillus sp.]|jgi:hypothetical protein|nr:hypothetical protein [Neobacillus sp.]